MTAPLPNQKLIDAVLHRASLDSVFRDRLLAEPDAAIADAFGLSIPNGVRIKFIEKERGWDEVYVLPELQQVDEELSDVDLDAVAGGQVPTSHRWDT